MNFKILYFGIYSKGIEYPRNNNLIRALRLNGIEVIEAHFELASSFQKRIQAVRYPLQTLRFFLNLIKSFAVLSWKFIRSPHVDVIIIGHPGYFHIHLAWFLRLFLKKQSILVYDIFIPLYEALVEDRHLIEQKSLAGHLLHQFEKSCCKMADLCLIDTQNHGQYISRQYGIDKAKIFSIFVGATITKHLKRSQMAIHKEFRVLFVGTYIPLHGIDVILNAARQLKAESDIIFTLVGTGQLREKIVEMAQQWNLPNVIFIKWIPTEQLGPFIQSFDLALGIFGGTPKTSRVIPSKIFDICAAGLPFITADTIAIKEIFSHGENAYLIPPGDSKALANAVLMLKINPKQRKVLMEGAQRIEERFFSLAKIGKTLIAIIKNYIHNRL